MFQLLIRFEHGSTMCATISFTQSRLTPIIAVANTIIAPVHEPRPDEAVFRVDRTSCTMLSDRSANTKAALVSV
jgi:hypothetical protein